MNKRMTINPSLSGNTKETKVYHAYLCDSYHVNMFPVVQRPSGQLTYIWKTSSGRASALGEVFDTRFEARDNAIQVLS